MSVSIRFVRGTDTLTIKDVVDDDEGTYTCSVNTTLDHDSASAMLTVVGKFDVVLTHTLCTTDPKGNVFCEFIFTFV